MVYEAFWVFVSYFADIAYWIGFTVSFLVVYPMLDKKDKAKVSWITYVLIPAVFLTYVVNFALKLIFSVPRPCAGLVGCPAGYSFPSGHASIAFAFAAIVILYERKYKSYLWAVPLAVLVGMSRIFLNFHTVIDVVGGAVVGTLVSLLVYKASDKIKILLERLHVLSKG